MVERVQPVRSKEHDGLDATLGRYMAQRGLTAKNRSTGAKDKCEPLTEAQTRQLIRAGRN
ncbi:MAG: hypothetical protein EU533_04465 [Promethearchaeota archaeon]|nr:MAG: hypothetical protein EU533_04465 [Candidatus Lokiarchaeota archaeon]